MCADVEKVENPEEAGEGGRAHAERCQGDRAERCDEGGINEGGQRFGRHREQHRQRECNEGAVGVFLEGMGHRMSKVIRGKGMGIVS